MRVAKESTAEDNAKHDSSERKWQVVGAKSRCEQKHRISNCHLPPLQKLWYRTKAKSPATVRNRKSAMKHSSAY
jgi:hypothetical protein